jgi:hypothetical protein
VSEDIQADVQSAISDALHGHGDMVVSWVLCAEVIDQDGERGMWALAPEEQKSWETLGLVVHAQQREQAKEIEWRLRDE